MQARNAKGLKDPSGKIDSAKKTETYFAQNDKNQSQKQNVESSKIETGIYIGMKAQQACQMRLN